MHTVIVINGKPRVGKDSAILAMQQILMAERVRTDAFSSIDPVRDMLTAAGFDLSAKTEADRALLAEVGDSVEKHSSFRSQVCMRKAASFFDADTTPGVMFLHARESVIINRLRRMFEAVGVRFLLVKITGPRGVTITSNAADAGVEDVEYDDVLHNGGDLTDLAYAADKLLFKHKVISQLSLLR